MQRYIDWLPAIWDGLDNTGRIVLITAVTVVLVSALYFGVDWSVWRGGG